jgi:hypothetical protein
MRHLRVRAVDGEPLGRVVVGVFGKGPAPLAARRFAELATNATGVSYRRTQFDAVRDGARTLARCARHRFAS